MALLIFETHSTSTDNEAGLASGWFDAPLSSAGEEQARQLGARLSTTSLDAIYTSDLERARQTAALALPARADVRTDPRLRECDYGTMTRQPTHALDAERLFRIERPFPQGESYQDVVVRVREWIDDTTRLHPAGVVLVIGHRATWYALEHLARGRSLADVIGAAWRWQPGWRYEL